jgi:hypothetical protein
MAVTTVSSSYALLEQRHRLLVGNPCTPTASAIASIDIHPDLKVRGFPNLTI